MTKNGGDGTKIDRDRRKGNMKEREQKKGPGNGKYRNTTRES